MKISFELLGMCDAIYMLKGWEESKGAKRENIRCAITRWKKGTVRCPGYIVVEVEDDLLF